MRRFILSALCALTLTGGLATTATAAPTGERAERGAPAAVGTTTETVTLPSGERVTHTATVGEAQVATAADLATDGDLVAVGGGPTLAERAADGPVYYRTWYQSASVPPFWKEQHEAKMYYDLTYVWVTVVYRGYQGYHSCDINSGIGFTINVTEFRVWGGEPKTGGPLEAWDRYKVSFVTNGIPVYGSHAMYATLYPSGNVYFHWPY